jgi:hypothetical protein
MHAQAAAQLNTGSSISLHFLSFRLPLPLDLDNAYAYVLEWIKDSTRFCNNIYGWNPSGDTRLDL